MMRRRLVKMLAKVLKVDIKPENRTHELDDKLDKKKVKHVYCGDCGEVPKVKSRVDKKEISDLEFLERIESAYNFDLESNDFLIFQINGSEQMQERFMNKFETHAGDGVGAMATNCLEDVYKINMEGLSDET